RRFDHVVLNNRAGMRDCVNRLIALGHRRLLFVCRRRTMLVAQYRIDGLIAAQRAATMPLAVDIVELLDDESRLLAELTRLCAEPDPPTAIIVSNNRQASYLLRALRVLGIESPRTVSVLAFDDPEWSELVTPRLSVVRQPAVAIARAAWRTLRRRLDDVDAPVRTIAMKQVIDFRESIGPAPARG
ncbi:MAG: LacI family DNA-binding transcriptional regulator, partial [Lautropia sp.]